MDLGNTIKDLRKKKLCSQKELAKKCDIIPSFLSLVEHNKTEVSMGTLKKISEALGIPYSVILLFSMETKDIKVNDIEWAKQVTAHAKELFTPIWTQIELYGKK
jgi:transcriptional regulator with XRE-family HTH domain